MFGSELEFFLLKETFAEAHAKNYIDLTPSVPYILDYHILATTYDEPFIRAVRKGMKAAGIPVESSKGEAWPGQQEINFRFSDALAMADNHVIYKNGIKEMAHQQGCSVTFMAKPDHRWIGSSCHVHSSLWKDQRNVFDGESPAFKQYLAGHIAYASELAIFLAPNINSYKRFAAGSWAPTTLAWGHDNRTCGFRIVGHAQHLRTESRIPGADANPYLCFAALLAAGLHGIEEKLTLPPEFKGNAYDSDVQRFPRSLREPIGLPDNGTLARQAFGADVIDHCLYYARTEHSLFDKVVTNHDRARRVGPRPGRERQRRVPVLQVRHPLPAQGRRRLSRQRGVLRRHPRRGHVPDRIHRIQGRGALDEPRAGGAVRPAGGARQRTVPRPGRNASADPNLPRN